MISLFFKLNKMKKLILVLLLCVSVFQVQAQDTNSDAITTYYLIRHAEKDRSDKTNRNPKLTKAGLERANHWATILKTVKFNQIYSTNYNRTKATALPTAIANNLELNLYNPSTLDIDAFKDETKGKNILIVGHSNTTPEFVNKLLDEKKYEMIEDNNNGNLYIVTISQTSKSDILLTIN